MFSLCFYVIFIILYFSLLLRNQTVDQDQNCRKDNPYLEEIAANFVAIH